MEITGLPLHALVVHAAVVFGPLAAVTAIVFALVPRWRGQLRWPSLGLSMAAVGAGVLAWFSGGSYLDAHPELRQLDQVRTHESRADVLIWVIVVFGLLAVAAVFVLDPRDRTGPVSKPRSPWLTRGVGLSLALSASALLVLVVLTGDAGARAVWG